MGIFRRLAGFLGIAKDEAEKLEDVDEFENENVAVSTSASAAAAPVPAPAQYPQRQGFSVPVQVAVDRAVSGPVLVPCSPGNGGVQGFKWYAKRLRMDEDGDVADEFFDEIPTEKCARNEESDRPLLRFQAKYSTRNEESDRPLLRFQAKYSTRSVKLSTQVRCLNGHVEFGIEHEGRLEWV